MNKYQHHGKYLIARVVEFSSGGDYLTFGTLRSPSQGCIDEYSEENIFG
jgi:hypothetical protein